MSEDVRLITAAYASQIIEAVRLHDDEGNAQYLVTELLREFAAKAHHQGRKHRDDEVRKFMLNTE